MTAGPFLGQELGQTVEGLPLREQEYFQAYLWYLLPLCSELDQTNSCSDPENQNKTRNLVLEQDFYTRE